MDFDFRMITAHDGTEIVDLRFKTSIEALDGIAMIEYNEMDKILFSLNRKRKPIKKTLGGIKKWR